MVPSPSSTRRVGAIDIGTNSILLTIAEATTDGGKRILLDRATVTRLGEGVDQTGQLAAGAVERSLACLRDYALILGDHATTQLDVVGTSALRDVGNAAAFLDQACGILGLCPRVIAGLEEARLTCLGALDGLSINGPLLVFDVGGGSTELIVGCAEPPGLCVTRSMSLDLGCVRLTERHFHHDPPTVEEVLAMTMAIDDALATTELERGLATVVAVAGTVTTLAAMNLGLSEYDPERVHGSLLSLSTIARLRATLLSLDSTARRGLLGLDPRRADVIAAGAVLVERIVRHLDVSCVHVSDRGVRFGLLLELLRRDGIT